VTKPFQFEGAKRMRQADEGVDALQKMVDTLIVIPNQNLFRLANEKTTFTEAFSMADDVLYQGVKGISDLMVRPGLINLDFADVRSVMDEMGKAMMGTGEAEGDDRAIQAAEKAIANPLLDEISLKGARGVLINITGGYDLTLFELDEAANRIREEVDPDANIIVGSTLDTDIDGSMRVSVVATGIDATEAHLDVPLPRRKLSEPLHSPEEVEQSVGHQHGAPTFSPASEPVAQQSYDTEPPAEPQHYAQPEQQEPQASFFDQEERPEGSYDQGFPAEEAGDDVPAPVFQSAPRQEPQYQQPQHQQQPEAAPVAQFVAPKAPQPGQPSPEAMARLEAAVGRSRAEQPRQAEPQQGGGERPRFGINSLINRMTGQGSEQAQAEPRREPQPRPQTQEEPQNDPDQERVEIPAFLRRQAN
jgi:cell division protein FtsZ